LVTAAMDVTVETNPIAKRMVKVFFIIHSPCNSIHGGILTYSRAQKKIQCIFSNKNAKDHPVFYTEWLFSILLITQYSFY
jgi:hypothetical protein